MNTGILILAAGSASRMQQPKMLLPFGKGTILSHLLEETKAMQPKVICVVTGFYHTAMLPLLETEPVMVVYNERWKDGMAGSVKTGLTALLEQHPALDSVMILVSDQPFITRILLQEMIQTQETSGKGIVAALYNGIKGTPALFNKKYFHHLQELQGDKGAKSILQLVPDDIATVDFAEGEMDIDTPEDYERFCAHIN
jgi:molybdenum cofactor cytidylyltransferase